MAAGLGFKEFIVGDVLTAADANGYLASQTVMVFASSAARASAITSPQEGMITYLKDTDVIQYYSGSAYVTVGGSASPLTTKGDLYGFSTVNARVGVGTNGQVLTADSTAATGVAWATPSAGKPTFQAYKSGSTQNLSANTTTKVTFQSESWDTNSNFASSTFTPTVAGYYQFNVCLNWEPTAAATLRVLSYKNGSAYQNLNGLRANAGETYYPAHGLVYLNGTTDTLEIYANSSTTSSIYQSDASITYFNAAGANS